MSFMSLLWSGFLNAKGAVMKILAVEESAMLRILEHLVWECCRFYSVLSRAINAYSMLLMDRLQLSTFLFFIFLAQVFSAWLWIVWGFRHVGKMKELSGECRIALHLKCRLRSIPLAGMRSQVYMCTLLLKCECRQTHSMCVWLYLLVTYSFNANILNAFKLLQSTYIIIVENRFCSLRNPVCIIKPLCF